MAGYAPYSASSDPGGNSSWVSVSQPALVLPKICVLSIALLITSSVFFLTWHAYKYGDQEQRVGDPAVYNGATDLEAQMKAVREKKADVRQRLAALGQLPSSSMSGPSATSKAAIAKRTAAVNTQLSRRQKGIDVAVVLDITGSMAPHLKAAQCKIKEIYNAVKAVHPQAEARVAFVGYRDLGTDRHHFSYSQFQLMDFVPYSRSGELVTFLESLHAGGGFGGCADVAGGLQKAAGLSWEAHTRLVVHFADIAAHGSRYNKRGANTHTGLAGCCGQWPDNQHPSGDAAMAVANLMSKNISYYFGEICPHETRKMTDVFQDISINMPKIFQVFPADANAADFVTVLESSLRSSMSGTGFGTNSIHGSKDSSAIKAAAAAQRTLDPSIEDYLEF